ncbi:MAG: hypothetical protein QM802_21780 [Agriterribacter sp.]
MKTDFEIVNDSWDENGFLGKLQDGIFDRTAYNILRDALLRLKTIDYDYFEKEFVAVIWFIPTFMRRKQEYIQDISSKELNSLKEELEGLIADILGYP